jgi:HSP20 family molecular chaperone IbpA
MMRRTERMRRNFVRSFALPKDVDGDNIRAHLEDGVLVRWFRLNMGICYRRPE